MTTTLDVLNHMLNVIGENPVSTVSSDHPSVISAMVQLKRVLREMQTRGWWFNTEYDLKLTPNEAGQIVIPSDTLFIDPTDSQSKLVKRGGKLYDPVNHTFNLGASVPVNVVLLLPVEDLPESAAMFVMHQAAYDFYVNDDGDETKSIRLEKKVDRAWATLINEELQALNLNAKNRPNAALLRSRMQQHGMQYNPKWPGGRA